MMLRSPTVVTIAAVLLALGATAQDLEPRAYSNAPVGLNFLVASYAYAEGEVAADPSLPLEDGEIELHTALLAYARTFGVLGRSAKVDAVVPYGWLSGSALVAGVPRSRRVSGLFDPRLRLSVNFLGSPALSLPDFQRWEQDLILGASLQVTAPLGAYDSDKAVNLGTNRWSVKPELGISKRWWGRLTTEAMTGVTIYTDNDDFFGGQTREQDPLYSVRAHVVYAVWRGIWASLDGTWYGGGRTSIDGQRSDDRQSNTRLGATLAVPVSRYGSIKVSGSTGVSVRTGGDFDTLSVAWQLRWGGGL